MNDPAGLLVEAKRAVNELGAVGVQVMSNILGRPLDKPDTMPLFDLMAELERRVWIHPIRGADFPDYQTEPKSYYEIWWCFGWAYETSAAMAHLVFSGLFDKHPNPQDYHPPPGRDHSLCGREDRVGWGCTGYAHFR